MRRLMLWSFIGLLVHFIAIAIVIVVWYQDANLVNWAFDVNGDLARWLARYFDSSGRLLTMVRILNLEKVFLFSEIGAFVLGVFFVIRQLYHNIFHRGRVHTL